VTVRIVRLGTPRGKAEGPRLGTVRRPPRGVKKADYARRNFYDVWLPVLSPSQPLVTKAMREAWTDARWAKFAAAYRREMKDPGPAQLIALLARLSHQADFSVGCYCEDESRCHRSVLRQLLREAGAKLA
jgi:uncharacterized protein YeaO (DUF488 family)